MSTTTLEETIPAHVPARVARISRADLPRWRTTTVRLGLLGGFIAVSIALQGMVVAFNDRFIIAGVIALGHLMILLALFGSGLVAAGRGGGGSALSSVLAGAGAGFLASAAAVLLIAVGTHIDLGNVFVNAVPKLYDELTFNLGLVSGSLVLLIVGLAMGAVAALVFLLPSRLRRAILIAALWIFGLGLLQDLIVTTLSNFNSLVPLLNFFYAQNGLSVPGAVILFAALAAIDYWGPSVQARVRGGARHYPAMSRPALKRLPGLFVLLVLVALPYLAGLYLSQVLDDVGIYVLMGLGLNIVVGFAGLLDLGYVAFFAIGAYTVGVLTTPDFGHPAYLPTWWLAVPVAVTAAMLAGVLLGIPVLKMRGDYLAIVTLGFGEIIRLLALSDFLKAYVGGAQGILDIAKPVVPWISQGAGPLSIVPVQLIHPEQFYYVILAGCVLVAFVATRVKHSRLGRAWMAVREDEDVAQAMGINLVTTKLMAFAMGASFGGLSGAIFGSQLGSVFPQSFDFIVSVNVLSLIIIGGMGNIPGVIVGAIALVGLPELLREVSDYRFLFYGAGLVLMMLLRPEGLLPESRRRMELEETPSEET
ncbi:MAG: leucine/isoleucine/valine transporter permease subunit [Chloroflexi bacterium]|nr:leucine/isoleucine/valine transporter permease subunit [Chloroflexota bacterium]